MGYSDGPPLSNISRSAPAQRGWVNPVPDAILPGKFLGYSRGSNPGPFGWQSDVLTTILNRWSSKINNNLKIKKTIHYIVH